MYILYLNIANAIKKMSVNEMRDFTLKTIRNELDFPKTSYYLMKYQKKKKELLCLQLN